MIGTFFQQQFVRRASPVGCSCWQSWPAAPCLAGHGPGAAGGGLTFQRVRTSEVCGGAEPGAGLLSAGIELQVNPARGMRIRVVPSAALEFELFIAIRRLDRPAVLKSDCTNVREGLVRRGSALPYPDGGARGCVAFHGVASPCIAAGTVGRTVSETGRR